MSEQAKTASLQERIKVLGILVSSFGFGLYFGWDHSSIFLGLGILGLIIFVFGLVSGTFSAKKGKHELIRELDRRAPANVRNKR